MLAKSLSAGFTMIELMIGLVILAILLSLGMPAFTWILESSGGADFDTKDGGESSGGSVTVTPNTAVVFNGLGRAAPAVDFDFSGFSGCGGEIRCLRVRVSAGGQVRVCDPAVTNTADTRSCGT